MAASTEAMTVSDLIDYLGQCDKDAIVVVNDDHAASLFLGLDEDDRPDYIIIGYVLQGAF